MTVFYLLRHGQSEANVKRIFTGQLDRYGLSPLGRRQAERAADYLADRGIDRIYSSDLLRARQTAEYAGRRLNLPVELCTGLREIFAGAWEGQTYETLAERYPEQYAAWRAGTDCHPNDGECAEEVGARMLETVTVLCRANPDRTLLLSAHAMVIRCFECVARFGNVSALPDVPFVKNASLSRYVWDGVGFTLLERDICSYLEGMVTELPKSV